LVGEGNCRLALPRSGRARFRRIAKAIVRARPIRDTAHLAKTVAGARKQWGRQRLHPATKTFLALRIAGNRELEELGQFLSRTPATMNSGGRWVVLSRSEEHTSELQSRRDLVCRL